MKEFQIDDISPEALGAAKSQLIYRRHGLSDEELRYAITSAVNVLSRQGILAPNEMCLRELRKTWPRR